MTYKYIEEVHEMTAEFIQELLKSSKRSSLMYCQLSDINKQSTHHTLCDKQAELKCPSCNSGVCLDHWDKMAGICKACAGVIDQLK